jgi:hypothetical protein
MSKKFTILFLSMAFISNMFAQRDDTTRLNEVIVIRPYEPTVSDAFKISSFPKIQESVVPVPNIQYSIIKKQIPTSFEVEPIKPAKIKGDKISSWIGHT